VEKTPKFLYNFRMQAYVFRHWKLAWPVLVVLASFLQSAPLQATEDLTFAELAARRPADSYALALSNDDSLCTTILTNLNVEWSLSATDRTIANSNADGDALLSSPLDVRPWRQNVKQPNLRGTLNIVPADLDRNGVPDLIYIVPSMLASQHLNLVFFEKDASLQSDFEIDAVKIESNLPIDFSFERIPAIWAAVGRNDLFAADGEFYVHVVRVGDENLFLLTPAIYWKQNWDHIVDIFAVRYVDATHLELTCHFRSRFRLAPENSP
jgi:hypothetical protein